MTPQSLILPRCREDGGCWVWLGCVQQCGTTPTFRPHGSSKTASVRRWVLQATGHDMTGKLATNTCESPLCVAPWHLAAVTRKDLQQRTAENLLLSTKMARAKSLRTARHATAKLTPSIVALLAQSPMPSADLARYMGVHKQTIDNALSGRHWRSMSASWFPTGL
jgi:hypothetical protein